MQFFWFGAILLCAALLPVFLAENWCRRHKVKKIFPVPRGMGWLQRTAVWLLCHLPDTISCSRWLTGCSEDIVGKLYPGMKKEKFIRQHVIRKMMVGYGGMLQSWHYDDLWSFESDAGIKRPIIFKGMMPEARVGTFRYLQR